jgi:hypothetical protein
LAAWVAPFRQMERMKRELRRIPEMLGARRSVRVCGVPAADDLEGQVRLEALVGLLEAHGLRARFGASGGDAAVWLGDGAAEFGALPALVWPRPDAEAAVLDAVKPRGGDGIVLCVPAGSRVASAGAAGFRTAAVPDVAHALWGLLDHHPQGGDGRVLSLDADIGGLLPRSRVAALERMQMLLTRGLAPAGLVAVARRRLIEAARRGLAAHAEVEAERIGPTILAALVGRGIRTRGGRGSAAAAYWKEWATEDRCGFQRA